MAQVGIYALLSSATAGGELLLDKKMKNFFVKNFQKDEGASEYIAENLSELPAEKLQLLVS